MLCGCLGGVWSRQHMLVGLGVCGAGDTGASLGGGGAGAPVPMLLTILTAAKIALPSASSPCLAPTVGLPPLPCLLSAPPTSPSWIPWRPTSCHLPPPPLCPHPIPLTYLAFPPPPPLPPPSPPHRPPTRPSRTSNSRPRPIANSWLRSLKLQGPRCTAWEQMNGT